MLAMICLSAALPLGCSSAPTTKGSVSIAVNPEVETSPGSQRLLSPKPVRGELDAPFSASWRVTLEVLQQSGYSLQEAIQKDGRIRTHDKQFTGPTSPWRESYSIWLSPSRNKNTAIKVHRLVRVYHRIFIIGPSTWTTQPSNGQRENWLIEMIAQRLKSIGVEQGEN